MPFHRKEKRKQRVSYWPKRKPSATRLAAQKIIRKSKPTSTNTESNKAPAEVKIPKVAQEMADSSDDTIIYTPPTSPTKKVRKGKAIFKIRLVRIKRPFETEEFKEQKRKALLRKCIYTCFLCGDKFPTTKTYNTHFKSRHDSLTCRDCDHDFNSPLSLNKHSYTHKDLDFKCRHCEKLFPFRSQMLQHQSTHEPAMCFHCAKENCTRSYSRASDLKLHIEQQHSASASFRCTHCDYVSKDIRNLRQHEWDHSEVHPYACSKCNKSFRFSMQWKRHHCD